MTAVDWLVEQMQNNIHHTIKIPSEYVEQAKQMEETELEHAYDRGHQDGYSEGYNEGVHDTENKD
jgi:flagellar biosynthesis/type III secretory pathway protein FliH